MKNTQNERIRELEEKIYCLETIIQNIHEGIILTDRNCIITVFNPAKAEMEHMDAGKALGEISWLAYEHSDWESSEHRRVMDSGKAILNAYRPHAFVGQAPVYINYDTVPIKKDGEIIGVYSICRTEYTLRKLLYGLLEHKRQILADAAAEADPVNIAEGTRYTFADITGTSPIMREIIKEAQAVSTMNMSILITGETGVGKEVLAQSIHNLGRERHKFIAINCAAIPAELFESTLFGTVKGAYTGAVNNIGLFREAGEGTLFLDEFNSLTPLNQTKLLRVLQERCVRPVGSTKEFPVQCRLICASNENLQTLLDEGRLRPDLYYRISEYCLEIPPLRERPEDIISLSLLFVKKYNKELGRNILHFSDELIHWMQNRAWYGNSRELQHAIQNMMLKASEFDDTLTLEDLPVVTRRAPARHQSESSFHRIPAAEPVKEAAKELTSEPVSGLTEILKTYQRELLIQTLEKENWNISSSARILQISRQTLLARMKRLQISSPHNPPSA